MSDSKHTPGPWVPDNDVVWGPDRRAVATSQGAARAEWQANAHLIAAAPDLLAALEEIVRNAEMYPRAPLREAASPTARRAIAKATVSVTPENAPQPPCGGETDSSGDDALEGS